MKPDTSGHFDCARGYQEPERRQLTDLEAKLLVALKALAVHCYLKKMKVRQAVADVVDEAIQAAEDIRL